MIPYIILLLIPSLCALFNTRRLSLVLWYAVFAYYVAFVGFRSEVGPDWNQYGYIHSSLANFSFDEVINQTEPLSYLLFWFSETSGQHIYLSNLVAAIIMMVGVCSFARRTANPWLALIAATPYFIIVMGMSGVRQTMAAGVVLFLFSRWERYSFIKRGAFIFIAAMFHTSALVNNIFLIIKMNIAMRYKLVLGAVVLAVTLYLGLGVSAYSDNVLVYQQRYFSGSVVLQSFGSLYHIAMIAIPAFLGFIYRKRIIENVHSESLLKFGLYAALAVLFMNIFSSTVASRLTIYLYFIPMMVYPALAAGQDRRVRQGSIFAVIAVHFLILVGWFQLANVSASYMSYKNILFDE